MLSVGARVNDAEFFNTSVLSRRINELNILGDRKLEVIQLSSNT